MSSCKHIWELSTTKFEYPQTNATALNNAVEYAYMVCHGCGSVKKTKVEAV